MLFLDLSKMLEEIEKEPSRLKMMTLASQILDKTNKKEVDVLIYLLLGQFGATYKEIDFGIAEKTIISALSKATGIDKEKINKELRKLGDLGLVGEQIISSKVQKSLFSKKLIVAEVYSSFEKLAKMGGKGSIADKTNILVQMINNANPIEAKYIIRIAQKNMRLGLANSTIIDSLSLKFLKDYKESNLEEFEKLKEDYGEDVERYLRYKFKEKIESKYNIYPDLGGIAKKLFEKGSNGLRDIGITPFVPVMPALAERLPSIGKIIEKLGKSIVEPKFDGFRLQCHYDGKEVKLFTRNLEDMSEIFPDAVETIKKSVKKYPIIFECEAIGYNEKEDKYYPFQVTMKRKRKYDIPGVSKQIPLRLVVFDIMYLKGSLIDKPLLERKQILENAMAPNKNLIFPENIYTDDVPRIQKFFERVLSEGNEGIMLKDPNAIYTAGARKFAWVKYKKSYSSRAKDTLDLLDMGYFSGKGQRSKFGIGALLVGSYNEKENRYESIAKLGSGLTEENLESLQKALSEIKETEKPKEYVSGINPHVWVRPKYVVEVLYDEITKSPTHLCAKDEMGGLALRFPRLIKIRSDKNKVQTSTTKEVLELFKSQ